MYVTHMDQILMPAEGASDVHDMGSETAGLGVWFHVSTPIRSEAVV